MHPLFRTNAVFSRFAGFASVLLEKVDDDDDDDDGALVE